MNYFIEGISIQLYIQCLIVQKKILKSIKIPFTPIKLNAINYYFHDLYIQMNGNFLFITKNKPEITTISFNHCQKNNKICKLKNNVNTYQIILFFKYPKNIKNLKKISVPIVILEEKCINSLLLDKLLIKIEKILKKDIYIKEIYKTLNVIKI